MAVKNRIKQLLVPLLVGLTIVMGFVGASSVNSNNYYQNHGVSITAIAIPQDPVKASASFAANLKGSIVGGQISGASDALKNIWGAISSWVAPKDYDLPSGSYSADTFWDRMSNEHDSSTEEFISSYTKVLRASGALKNYNNADILSQILAVFLQIFAVIGGIILLILLTATILVQNLGHFIIQLVGKLNIFDYIGKAFEGQSVNDEFGKGLQPLIDIWMQLKPLILGVATLVFIFVIVKSIMGSRGSRGRTFGTGVMKYMSVFFAWGALPFVLSGIISYTTTIANSMDVEQSATNQLYSSFYNAKAPFASAFYKLDPATGAGIVDTDIGGMNTSDIAASWQIAPYLHLSNNDFGIITLWMGGDKFNADDVNNLIGWTGTSSSDNNEGYFSHKGDKKKSSDDNGQSWQESHKWLYDQMGDGAAKGGQPVISDDNLKKAGFTDDLFTQTARGSDASPDPGSDRLRRLALTHALAVWGIDGSGKINVSRETGMNTSTNVSWNSVTLVGDTPVARSANFSQLTAKLFFTVMYAVIAYVGIAVILAKMIGQALVDQLRASTGSVGAVARAFLSVLMTALIIWYIALSVGMVSPMIAAVNGLLMGIIKSIGGNTPAASLVAQLISTVATWMGGYMVVRLFLQLRTTIMQGAETMVNQMAEAIDRAMGIQPGTDSSASAGMKKGAQEARRNANSGFKAMDKTKSLENSAVGAAGRGLQAAGQAAEDAGEAIGAYEGGSALQKAVGVGMRGLGKAAKKTGKGIEKGAKMDETFDKAGMGAVAKTALTNGKDAYDETRANGGSIQDAVNQGLESAGKTATGDQQDLRDPNANAETPEEQAKMSDYNKVISAEQTLRRFRSGKKKLAQTGKQLTAATDAGADLQAADQAHTEAQQDYGAAQFAQAHEDGQATNAQVADQAQSGLKSSEETYQKAQQETAKSRIVLDSAQQKLTEVKQGAKTESAQIRQDVADGKLSAKDGKAQLVGLRQKVTQQTQEVVKAQEVVDHNVQVETEALNKVHQSQGAVKMTQAAVNTQGAGATFKAPAGKQTVTQLEQKVTDTNKVLVNRQQTVNNIVGLTGSTTVHQTMTAGSSHVKGLSDAMNAQKQSLSQMESAARQAKQQLAQAKNNSYNGPKKIDGGE